MVGNCSLYPFLVRFACLGSFERERSGSSGRYCCVTAGFCIRFRRTSKKAAILVGGLKGQPILHVGILEEVDVLVRRSNRIVSILVRLPGDQF